MQTLRLDDYAAKGLTSTGLVGIAGMGYSLRQLALHRLQHVSDDSLMTTLAQLPMLQVSFVDLDVWQEPSAELDPSACLALHVGQVCKQRACGRGCIRME